MIFPFPFVELPSWSWGSALLTIVGAADWPLIVTHHSQHDTALIWMWIMQWVATIEICSEGSNQSYWICLVLSDLVCPHPKPLMSPSNVHSTWQFSVRNINTIPVSTNTNVFVFINHLFVHYHVSCVFCSPNPIFPMSLLSVLWFFHLQDVPHKWQGCAILSFIVWLCHCWPDVCCYSSCCDSQQIMLKYKAPTEYINVK
jgi:hypothetical protein